MSHNTTASSPPLSLAPRLTRPTRQTCPTPSDSPAWSASQSGPHKYIIARDYLGRERVIVFSRDLPHNAMLPPNHDAISAGFVAVYAGNLILPNIGSDTLNLEPRPRDKQLLKAFFGCNDTP